MTPAVGLMKLLEMGLEKGGMRDSMETRQMLELKRQAQLAQNPMMSAIPNNPMNALSPTGTQPMQSPVESVSATPIDTNPDFMDKMIGILSALGPQNSLAGPPKLLAPTPVENLNPQPENKPGLVTILKILAGGI